MENYLNATYAINMYDDEGSMYDKCYLINIGNTILRFEHVEEIEGFSKRLQKLADEIKRG